MVIPEEKEKKKKDIEVAQFFPSLTLGQNRQTYGQTDRQMDKEMGRHTIHLSAIQVSQLQKYKGKKINNFKKITDTLACWEKRIMLRA